VRVCDIGINLSVPLFTFYISLYNVQTIGADNVNDSSKT